MLQIMNSADVALGIDVAQRDRFGSFVKLGTDGRRTPAMRLFQSENISVTRNYSMLLVPFVESVE